MSEKANLEQKGDKEQLEILIPDYYVEKIIDNLEICAEYEWLLGICIDCHSLYFKHEDFQEPKDVYRGKKIGQFSHKIKVVKTAVRHINNIVPPLEPSDLVKALRKKIKDFSGYLCCLCYAVTRQGKDVRQSQIKEGNKPCFGSGVGSCVHEDCCYYKTCVVDRQRLNTWRKRIQYKGLFKNVEHLR